MFAKDKRRCLNPTNSVTAVINERTIRDALIIVAFAALTVGLAAAFSGRDGLAQWIWVVGTIPMVAGHAISIARDVLGVDAVAFISMAAALALGQSLAGVVVAIMYAGGTVLEDFAVGRAERDLKSLGDCAPRAAHRKAGGRLKTCQSIGSLSEMISSCARA
jgi:cation transport ATPase